VRAVDAEAVRLGGIRGPLVRATLPLALLLPVLVTLAVGAAAESLHGGDGLIQVRESSTTNSIYWVISLGVTVHAVVAAYAQATSMRDGPGELARHILPGPAADLIGRWLVTGLVGAVCSFFAALMMLVALPAFFPGVYGQVDVTSAEGIRFLWAVPVYCFIACGVGVGVGALVRVPAAAVALLTLWSLLIESAVVYVPKGAELVRWMPFLNGTYGTGQEISLEPPWSPDGGLLYFLVVAAALVVLGILLQRVRRLRD
jgi:ABC-2 type transport system permease protein